MSIIAALYARVSTTAQEEEATIDSQVAAIEGYMKQKGYELPAEFYFLDKAVSGARLERPALDRLRHLATERVLTVVVCYSPDRLARNYPHQWVVMDELQRQGVRVEFVNQPDFGDNPQAQLLLGVQGLFAEYERAMIKERLRLGRLYKIKTGQMMHNTPPYGYRYVFVSEGGGGQWVIDEQEAEVVRLIFEWYTGSENWPIAKIIDKLNQDYSHVLRRATRWQFSLVHGILTQTAYSGQAYYNRKRILPETLGTPRQTGRGKRKAAQFELRPEEEWIELKVPPLVEFNVWQRAQEQLKMNQKFSQRNNKSNFYLLRGLVVCGACGYTMQGRTQNGRVYYSCRSNQKHLDLTKHSCNVAGKVLEPIVWEAITGLLQNPEQIAAAWEAETEEYDTMPDELGRLQARQRKLEQQWVRLLDAFQDSLIGKDELSQRKEKLDKERYNIATRIEQMQRQQEKQSDKAEIMAHFADFCAVAQKSTENATREVKQEVLRLLVESIVLEDETVTIKHIIPTDEKCRLLSSDLSRIYPFMGDIQNQIKIGTKMTKNTNFSLQETLNISVITQTDLAKHIQATPLANTHEHLASEDEWVHNGPDVLADLFAMYIGNDLLSAGAPYANVERLLDAKDPDISRRWAGVKNAWEHCKYTGYGRAVSHIAKLIYGIDEITTSAVITAQSRITALQQPGQRLHLLKEVANLDHVQIDNFVRACKPDPSGLDFFLYDISWVDFVIGKIEFEELFNEFDIEITDLKSLRAVMAATFTRYASCAIAVKSQHAYNRTIFWQEREDADAEQVLQKLLSGTELSKSEKLCLGDWCLAQGVELAIKYQLPFKIHTGYLAGNDYYTQPLRTHPAGLAPLLARYPEANFVLMHIAYPYSDDIIALAKHFPNAYIDMCWSWSINPYHAADFVRRFLHAVPRNKLFVFGGDNIWPTGSVAYAAQTRYWLTYALQGEIDDRLITETEAINIATRLMIQNQTEFFDLISTRSAIQATFSGS